jgi:hypothetical protein
MFNQIPGLVFPDFFFFFLLSFRTYFLYQKNLTKSTCARQHLSPATCPSTEWRVESGEHTEESSAFVVLIEQSIVFYFR